MRSRSISSTVPLSEAPPWSPSRPPTASTASSTRCGTFLMSLALPAYLEEHRGERGGASGTHEKVRVHARDIRFVETGVRSRSRLSSSWSLTAAAREGLA